MIDMLRMHKIDSRTADSPSPAMLLLNTNDTFVLRFSECDTVCLVEYTVTVIHVYTYKSLTFLSITKYFIFVRFL